MGRLGRSVLDPAHNGSKLFDSYLIYLFSNHFESDLIDSSVKSSFKIPTH
jgi:hypothetical protein